VEITEVRVKLVDATADRLQAFCTITLGREFVVRDLRIIQGQRGPFVAMPSRKLMGKCPSCYTKNEVRARYCNGCGARLPEHSGKPQAAEVGLSSISRIRSTQLAEPEFRMPSCRHSNQSWSDRRIRTMSARTTITTKCWRSVEPANVRRTMVHRNPQLVPTPHPTRITRKRTHKSPDDESADTMVALRSIASTVCCVMNDASLC